MVKAVFTPSPRGWTLGTVGDLAGPSGWRVLAAPADVQDEDGPVATSPAVVATQAAAAVEFARVTLAAATLSSGGLGLWPGVSEDRPHTAVVLLRPGSVLARLTHHQQPTLSLTIATDRPRVEARWCPPGASAGPRFDVASSVISTPLLIFLLRGFDALEDLLGEGLLALDLVPPADPAHS